ARPRPIALPPIPWPGAAEEDALPHDRLRDLLRRDLPWALAAEPAPGALEALHDRRQLLLLRLVDGLLRLAPGGRLDDRAARGARRPPREERARAQVGDDRG